MFADIYGPFNVDINKVVLDYHGYLNYVPRYMESVQILILFKLYLLLYYVTS